MMLLCLVSRYHVTVLCFHFLLTVGIVSTGQGIGNNVQWCRCCLRNQSLSHNASAPLPHSQSIYQSPAYSRRQWKYTMTAKIRAAMLNVKWKCIGVSDVQTYLCRCSFFTTCESNGALNWLKQLKVHLIRWDPDILGSFKWKCFGLSPLDRESSLFLLTASDWFSTTSEKTFWQQLLDSIS